MTNDGTPDMVFFDLTVDSGSRSYELATLTTTDRVVTLAGMTFDSPTSIPTPAALPAGLLLLGVMAIKRHR